MNGQGVGEVVLDEVVKSTKCMSRQKLIALIQQPSNNESCFDHSAERKKNPATLFTHP